MAEYNIMFEHNLDTQLGDYLYRNEMNFILYCNFFSIGTKSNGMECKSTFFITIIMCCNK